LPLGRCSHERAELGIADTNSQVLELWPHILKTYSTDNINIDGRTKIKLNIDMPLLVRPRYITKDTTFTTTIIVTPKDGVTAKFDNMKAGEGEKANSYTADITTKTGGDFWYRGMTKTTMETPPDNLVVTRKWEKIGNTWGECTIRIQTTARWHFWIYLPNNLTNTNNLNTQPNEVNDGGKTFRWYDWYDLSQGMTIKFPVEVGANVTAFYPAIRLERGCWGMYYGNKNGKGKDGPYDYKYFTVNFTTETETPYQYVSPGNAIVTTQRYLKVNRETVKRFVRGLVDTISFVKRQPEKTKSLLVNIYRQTDETIIGKRYEAMLTLFPDYPYLTANAVRSFLEILREDGKLKAPLDPEAFLDMSLLHEVEKENKK
jgi:hypothetical protein